MSVSGWRGIHARKIRRGARRPATCSKSPARPRNACRPGATGLRDPPALALRRAGFKGLRAVGRRSARRMGGLRRRRRERRRGRGIRDPEKRCRPPPTVAGRRLRGDRPARLLAGRPPSALPRRPRDRWSEEMWSVRRGNGSRGGQAQRRLPGAGVPYFRVPTVGDRMARLVDTGSGKEAWSVPITGPRPRRAPRSARGGRRDATERLLPAGRRAPPHPVPRHPRDFRPGLHRANRRPAGRGDPPRRRDPGRLRPARRRLHSRFDAPALCRLLPPGSAFTQLWSVPAPDPPPPPSRSPEASPPAAEIATLPYSPDSQRVVFSADRLVDGQRPVERSGRRADGGARAAQPVAASRTATSRTTSAISPDSTRVAYIADQVSDERFFRLLGADRGTFGESASLDQGVLLVGADAQELAFTPDCSPGSSSASISP